MSVAQPVLLFDVGVTAEQCEQAVQWVGADNKVLSAHIAVAQVLIDAGTGWAGIGRAMLLPGLRQLSGLVYRWIARNRSRLPGGTPACSIADHRGIDAR